MAITLGREAILRGFTVLFANATALVANLMKAQAENRLEERLMHYKKPKLLLIDELGYVPFEAGAAHLLFELINRRYEGGSLLVTGNLTSSEWGSVFGDPVIATRRRAASPARRGRSASPTPPV